MLHGRRASAIYVNTFSGEATTQLPTALQMARGGVCLNSDPLLFQFDFHSEMSMTVIVSSSLWDNSTIQSFYNTRLYHTPIKYRCI